jgi:uncharacterized protein (DUF885 family)
MINRTFTTPSLTRLGLPCALLAAALLTACNRSEDAASAPKPATRFGGDAATQQALTAYAVEFLRRNPTTNTYLGGAGLDPSLREVDGLLRDHSAAALLQEDRWLENAGRQLEMVDAKDLSPAVRIDRDVALAQIRFLQHQHLQRQYQARALDTYVIEPFRSLDWQLQGLTQTGENSYGTPDEWSLVVKRVRAIPTFLVRAQEQLRAGIASDRVPDRRMIERDGITSAEANAKYFTDTLPSIAAERISGADRDRLLADLKTAGAQAGTAYLQFRDFVKMTYFDGAKIKPQFAADRYAMGEDEYNWALKNNLHLDTTAARLYDEAWPIVEATQQKMVELAREIGQQRRLALPADGRAAVRAVFDTLSKDYPKNDAEMIAWYRDASFRLVDYGRRTGVFDVPADYKLDVVETPPPLQASIDGAAYYPAPPFKKSGVGRFYVSPTHNDVAALQMNNRAALADLAAHEGFPGHDWYYKVLADAPEKVSPVRWLTPGAVEDSSSMWEDSPAAEGWGLYSEALMAEPQPGSPNGFYTPEERLYQLQGELYRDLRVRIDTGIHTGRMTYDAAVTLFSEVVDFLPGSCTDKSARSAAKRASCDSAERAIFRYSKWPTQAITYRLGKDQIYALREEASKAMGANFSPKTFHLYFIRQGTIPVGYFRDSLLEQLRTTQK